MKKQNFCCCSRIPTPAHVSSILVVAQALAASLPCPFAHPAPISSRLTTLSNSPFKFWPNFDLFYHFHPSLHHSLSWSRQQPPLWPSLLLPRPTLPVFEELKDLLWRRKLYHGPPLLRILQWPLSSLRSERQNSATPVCSALLNPLTPRLPPALPLTPLQPHWPPRPVHPLACLSSESELLPGVVLCTHNHTDLPFLPPAVLYSPTTWALP